MPIWRDGPPVGTREVALRVFPCSAIPGALSPEVFYSISLCVEGFSLPGPSSDCKQVSRLAGVSM